MSNPKLTIGMATYDDYDGCYFTLQALRLYHDLRDVELLVIDNKPDSGGSNTLKVTMEHMMNGRKCHSARYIPSPEVIGTSAPRDKVFREANGAAVLCVDSHILLQPNAVTRLIEWYDAHSDTGDLVTGPLMYDTLEVAATHFDDVWRGEMWGTWGQAWEVCPGGDVVATTQNGEFVGFASLEMNPVKLSSSSKCAKSLPTDIPFPGHEKRLEEWGMRRLGWRDDDEFEIPGMGLGIFSCRKEAWLGFNEHFRGFGGEEMYIHQKFRNAGHRCLCLGFLKWVHRFHRSNGTRYPLQRFDRVRNYVLGHHEIRFPMERIREHFVVSGLTPVKEWDAIMKDPVRATLPKPASVSEPATIDSPEVAFEMVRQIPRDFDQHMERLKYFAGRCKSATEFSHRRESLLSLICACPVVISHNSEKDDPVTQRVIQLLGSASQITLDAENSPNVASIAETDLLFIDSLHTKDRLLGELTKFAPQTKRYIIMHDLVAYGSRGEDNGPGLLEAIREFSNTEEGQRWFVAFHTSEQHGFTVLGCLEEDKPPHEIRLYMPGHGPGTELKKMITKLGITQPPNCSCNALAGKMDIGGPDWCVENKQYILDEMAKNWEGWGWKGKVMQAAKAGFSSLITGMIFKINPANPMESLVDEAIERARKSRI